MNKKFLFINPDLKKRRELFTPHPYLSVALKKNVDVKFDNNLEYHSIKTTELGTRWTGADLSDTSKIRIACLGGSTTFCTGVDDSETWPSLLQQYLGERYAVVNYGVPAYKTSESVIQLAIYVPELKPDIVIFYQGVNDMYNYYMESNYPDYLYHSEELMPMALLGVKLNETVLDKLIRQSGFFYIVNNIRERYVDQPATIIRHTEPDVVVDSLFVRNTRTMLTLASQINSRPIIISQVLNPYHEKIEEPWSIRVRKDLILPMMRRMNRMSEKICDNDSACTYLDFEKNIKWKPEHFWDDMHFTKEGNDVFARKLAEEIKSIQ